MEGKIAIILHTFSGRGGGERVSVSTIEALNHAGVVPHVYTTSPIQLNFLPSFCGKNIKIHVHSIAPFSISLFSIYQPLIISFSSFRLIDYDVVINTSGIYTPFFFKNLVKRYILYVYNPLGPLQLIEAKENLRYQKSLFWKLYFQPYQNLIKHGLNKLGEAELLAVSDFTKWRIKKYWNRESRTVYPPVDISSFSQVFNNKAREGVISVGTFYPEKNHLLQLEIAKHLPDVTFRICGSAESSFYWKWFLHVKAKAEETDLKNVEFYPNIPFSKLVELIGESKFFIHTMINEDFGLATCEAIAGGCLPVVHDSGGQREVVPYRFLRWNNVKEAAKILKGSYPEYLRDELFRHIQQFSEKNFHEKILKVIFGLKQQKVPETNKEERIHGKSQALPFLH
ncbi:MAG: glycosyltransferase [Candidatus Bathycorpusculaceae bacterium]